MDDEIHDIIRIEEIVPEWKGDGIINNACDLIFPWRKNYDQFQNYRESLWIAFGFIVSITFHI